jgi:5-methylcytosine-specific restriction endonuclease McrA
VKEMSKTYIPVGLRRPVTERANNRCSYCLTPSEIIGSPFTIDHIMPESLGGATTEDDLCL